jgi:hypothetical protein
LFKQIRALFSNQGCPFFKTFIDDNDTAKESQYWQDPIIQLKKVKKKQRENQSKSKKDSANWKRTKASPKIIPMETDAGNIAIVLKLPFRRKSVLRFKFRELSFRIRNQ